MQSALARQQHSPAAADTQLAAIRAPVAADLATVDHFITEELLSDVPLINELAQYVLVAGGKRIRPLVALLMARACGYNDTQSTHLAAAIELIHTATLLHDDVVDHSALRRGNETANEIWGNEASVLVGDFLYSRAFQLIVRLQQPTILTLFADATNLIAEGEVMQFANRNQPDLSEAAYYSVIERKTAKLFEVAAGSGAALGHAERHLRAAQRYGLHLGLAYQLIDDALDYHSSAEAMGKNTGDDLAEGKATLPLIYALQHADSADAARIRQAVATGTIENFNTILAIIESTGAIGYTAAAAKMQAQNAITCLADLPDSAYKQALCDLAQFVVDRTY